ERFNTDLCNAVTGRNDSQALLEKIEQANLFLIPLDDERKWYRYHHLFRDLLQQRLHSQVDTTAINELHQSAAHYLQAQGLIDEAIRHYLAGAAPDQAATLIEQVGFERIGQGYLVRLRHWMDLLPLEIVRTRPWLALYRAWLLNLSGQPAALAQWLQETELSPQSAPTDLGEDMQAQIMTLHAYQMRHQGQIGLAIVTLRQVLQQETAGNYLTRSTAHINLGYNYWLTGQLTLAEQALQMAQSEAQTIQAVHAALMAKSTQAIVAVAQGHLRRAVQLCKETIQEGLVYTGGQPFASAGYAYAVLGNVWYEQNQWAKAESALHQALELGELVVDGTIIRRAIFGLAPLKQIAGDAVAAQTLWQRAFAADDTVEEPYVRLQQVRTWLVQAGLQGDQAALIQAGQWAATDSPPQIDQHTYIAAYTQMLYGWLDLLQGQADRTLKRLTPLLEAARTAGHTQHLIQLLAIRSLAHAAMGDTDLAHAQLHQLLHLTAPEGYIRIYVDMGEPMYDLLESLRMSSTDLLLADHGKQLLAAFAQPAGAQSGAEAASHIDSPSPTNVNRKSQIVNLIEPLSERELEILYLVAGGLSNSQLAETLIVTVGTVKKHL
ncbi:MAG: hypothetical protein KDE31_23280, partial [Caldilineaceae bacterium]|nr:hypothetical protein [Caldilineaceae bacterium]